MHRFYVPWEIAGNTVCISEAGLLHHLDVLRLNIGGEVVLFDSAGNEYNCRIEELDKERAVLAVKEKRVVEVNKVTITVACAIPKNARMDDIVDQLTQVGVDTIIPMETERVVIRLDQVRRQARLGRWRRIAQSTAQQSQRSSVPLVQPVTGFGSVVSGSTEFDLKLIPTLAGERRALRQVIAGARVSNILVLIGPEGDFTLEEVALASDAGFIPVSLGKSVLRVATAAIAVASHIRFALGESEEVEGAQ